MLGDGTQPAGDDRPRDSVTSGPRHAAPRKSLLTKLHMPAGKAVALAAMPTAVLMGMGMTPHLAQADERPSSPFKAGPCVTQSETPSATPSTTDTKGATDKGTDGTASAKPTPTATTGADAGSSGGASTGTPAPTTSPAAAQPKKSTAPAARTQPEPASTPSATPSPTHSVNPLDPLGLGNLVGGLLGGTKQTPQPAPTTQAPQPPATTAPATTAPATPKPADPAPGKPSSGSSTGSTGTVGKTVKSLTDGASSGASKAAKDLTGDAGTPSPTASPSATPSPDPSGKQAYPCPTYDAKALADAKTEGGIPLLPDEPWTLKSNLLTLYGLNYDGIVQVRTWSGTVKDVMKFTATGIDIGNLQQVVQGPNGTTTHVSARTGTTSTIRNGTVTMYTESLSGNLLGLVPITFTPKAPPPLTLPVLFFTDATVIQAGQFGGDLTVPGLRVLPDQPAQ